MKIIHFSDIHLETNTVEITVTLLKLIILKKYINTHFSNFDFCIVSGDLVNGNQYEPYKVLYKELMEFKIPVYCVIGNHDNPESFREVFSHYNFESEKKCYYKKESNDNIFLFLDTHKDTCKSGELGILQLSWLQNQLDTYSKKTIYIVMHHHFFKSHNASLDCMDLEDKDAFVKIVSNAKNIKHIFLGHLHMNLTGKINNISYSCVRSIKYQISYNETSLTHTTEDTTPSVSIINIDTLQTSIFYQDMKVLQ
jgi:3',5'-cyclic AMP phosphodiesterase CpdA